MKRRLILLALLAVAVTLLLWIKSRVARDSARPTTPPTSLSATSMRAHSTTVLLFVDPREATKSCGCGKITDLVRGMRGTPGVVVKEVDSRRPGQDARRYRVHVSPTVVILDAAGKERARFEGESGATIQALHAALAALGRPSKSAERGAAR